MPFEKNNTYGEQTKRGKNKSSELLKEQLHKIANTVVNELDLGRLTNNQRIQLIKAVLPYLISKQKNIEDLQQEQPLFQIEIIDSLSKN
ncbi:hypothetical protein N9L21_02810 [Flavobacteriaceae bacterium]|jgi:hypothetical protein|nr:hypothetical protein [Flavobacteriaceae bacterium]